MRGTFFAGALSLLVAASIASPVPARVASSTIRWPSPVDLPGNRGLAQAGIDIQCRRCFADRFKEYLHFDINAFATPETCSSPNITINGENLQHDWFETGGFGSGLFFYDDWTTVELSWNTRCLTAPDTHSVQNPATVITVTVDKVNGRPVPESRYPRGFTASFSQSPHVELLRVSYTPITPVPEQPSEDWRQPPYYLRYTKYWAAKSGHAAHPRNTIYPAVVPEIPVGVQRFQLEGVFRQQEKLVAPDDTGPQGSARGIDIRRCGDSYCVFKDNIEPGANGASNFIGFLIRPDFPSDDQQGVNMHNPNGRPGSSIRPPDAAHLPGRYDPHNDHHRPSWSPSNPYYYPSSSSGSYRDYEKLPGSSGGSIYRRPIHVSNHHSKRRRNFMAVLHFIFVLLGLAALFRFIRRRFASLRTRRERAANREERRNRRAYRRAARRAAFKTWWSSVFRFGGTHHQRMRLDYEEKRALIAEQEGRLEVAMHDEIQELRRAHGVVDELVRAEEGRGTVTRPVIIRGRMPGMASIAGVMMGGDLPYPPSYLSGSTVVSQTDETEDGSTVVTPPTSATFSNTRSRTNSLPSYRTEPSDTSAGSSQNGDYDVDNRSLFSVPPAYRTDDDDDSSSSSDSESSTGVPAIEAVSNGFTQYSPSEYAPSLLSPTDTASIFTPESSVPDVSPRESAETARTFM